MRQETATSPPSPRHLIPPAMPRNSKLTDYLGATLIFLMGAGALLLGMHGCHDIHHLQKHGLHAEGTVIDLISTTHTEGGGRSKSPRRTRVTYTPVVRYTDADGNHRHGKSLHSAVNYQNLKKGDKVTILYHPNEPENILLPAPSAKGGPIFFMIVGSFFCLIGGYLFKSAIRNKQGQSDN